jgi:hypothetical protein
VKSKSPSLADTPDEALVEAVRVALIRDAESGARVVDVIVEAVRTALRDTGSDVPPVKELIKFRNVPSIYPHRVDISEVFRFRHPGVRGVCLQAVKVPGAGFCTTMEWLRQFIAATQEAATTSTTKAPARRRNRLAKAFDGREVRK